MPRLIHGIHGVFILAIASLSCRTPPPPVAASPVARSSSAEVLLAGMPADCCPTCTSIELRVRNTSDVPVAIEWPSARFEHNGAAVEMVLSGAVATLAPHSTSTAHVHPKPGAPHATSLQEGKLRNGRYSVHLSARSGDEVTTASTEVHIDYEQDASSTLACAPK